MRTMLVAVGMLFAVGLMGCYGVEEGDADGGTDTTTSSDADTDGDSDTDTAWPDNPVCDPLPDPYPELETITFTGEPGGTLWGGGTIAADLDGDGIDDILLIDFGGSVPSTTSHPDVRGAIYVFYGRADFAPDISVLDADAILRGAKESAAAAGDVNGDGYDDVAFTSAAGAHLLYGGPTRLAGELLSTDVAVTMTAAFPDGPAEYMKVTGNLDANGDGLADLLVDVRAKTGSEKPPARNYLVLGRPEPLPADFAMESADAVFEGTADDARSDIGSVSAGDFDGDGFADLLIPVVDSTNPGAGSTSLFYGGDAAFDGPVDVASGSASFTWSRLWFAPGTLGDLDGDGFADLALAIYSATHSLVPIIYGRAERLLGDVDPSDVAFVIRAHGDDPYLAGLAVGDVNGDGRPDLVLGDPHDATHGAQSGALYLILGEDGQRKCDIDLRSAYALRYGQETNGDIKLAEDLGYAVASGGDVNGDGYQDIVVGAPGNEIGEEFGGAAYLLLGQAF